MRFLTYLLLLCSVCVGQEPQSQVVSRGVRSTVVRIRSQESWLSGYSYRKELAIPAEAVSADLTDWPTLINLSGDTDLAAHAQADGSDIAFTGADKVTVLPFEVPRRVRGLILNSGAGNWCTDPRSIKIGTKIFLSAVTSTGYPVVISYDTATGARGASGGLFSGGVMETDDHDQAALLELSDGKIGAAYQVHNGNAYTRVSSNAGDITAWGTERNWTTVGGMAVHAYAHLFRLTGETNAIYLFFRGGTAAGDRKQWVAKTTEAGLAAGTWDSVTQWLDTGQAYPYIKAVSNGTDKIHVVFTEAHPNDFATSLYYGYHYDGAWYKADGTLIGADAAMPIAHTSFEKIYDVATAGRCWAYDIALDGDGNPAIAYYAYPGAGHDSAPDHRARYIRWSGSAWVDNEITAAGTSMYPGGNPGDAQEYYSGGMSLDHNDPSTVYIARNNTGSGKFDAEKWITTDNGETWTHSTIATGDDYYRPMFTWGAASDDPWAVTWMKGTYTSFTNYATSIVAIGDHLEAKDQSWLQTAHVLIPSITAAGGAKAYLYYGRSNPPDVSDAAGLWSGSQFIVHGNSYDDGLTFRESKSGVLKLVGKYPTLSEAAGKIGRAVYFPNAGRLQLGTFNLAGRKTLSVMGWVKGATGYIISNLGSDTNKAGMYLRIHSSSHKLDMWARDSAGTAISGVFESTVFDASTWHHIAVVFDADNGGWKAWIDGTQSVTTRAMANAFHATASDSWDLGYCVFASTSFTGYLSIMRPIAGVLTEAQIKADYAAGNSPATFVQRGAEQGR